MKIAIQGHPIRGKEVIKILESLGGKNIHELYGNGKDCVHHYHIDSCGIITLSSKYDLHNYKFYTLEEFETQFPFKIGDKVIIVGLPDYPKVITKMTWMDNEIVYTFGDNTWYNTGALRKLEMKEERNITLTLDKAKEWYKKGGELKEVALQAFAEKELIKVELPKTWKEFCKKYPVQKEECWLSDADEILQCSYFQHRINKNWIPSKKSAEAHLAMIQLEQLRNCWWGDWRPEWNISPKYAIKNLQGEITIIGCSNLAAFLVFPTGEMAEEFLECFRDLIEKAGDLI